MHVTEFFCQSWIRVRIKYLIFVIIAVSFYAVAFNKQYRFIVVDDLNTLGLLVGYIASLTNLSHNLIAGISHLMKMMSSVERLREYTQNKIFEKPWYLNQDGSWSYFKNAKKAVKDLTLEQSADEIGCIKIVNVDVRYRPDLPLVLK